MNTIKFLPNNNVLLNNKTLLTQINNTNQYASWYTIKNKNYADTMEDRKSTRLNSSHSQQSRMPSSA